jgi:hypothetical protein
MKALWAALGVVLAAGCGAPTHGGSGGGGDLGGGTAASGGGSTAVGGGASSASGGGSAAMGGGSGAMGGGSGATGGGAGAMGGGTGAMGGGAGAMGGGTGTGGGTSMMPAPSGCVTDVTAGHHKFTCGTITYDVEVPTACAAGGCGVVFDIHGLTMNADQEDKSTNLRALGNSMGYVIVQPTAPNVGIGPGWTPPTDDPKVWSFVGDVRTALVINPKKIHFTGFSQGGAMTWRFICAHADVLASAAPVADCDGQTLTPYMPPYPNDCAFDGGFPSQPVPVLQMHGTQDGLCPFAKGAQQRDLAIAAWGLTTPTVVEADMSHGWTRYTSASGAILEFIQHDYLVDPPALPVPLKGHCLPGGTDLKANAPLGELMYFSCAPPNAFVWGQALMTFFAAHPRP